MIDIATKHALVTGSSRGIGQQVAIGLAQNGCHVIVHGRTAESCMETLRILNEFEVNSFCVFGDLAVEEEYQSVLKQIKDLGISIDILYNNAAICKPPLDDYWKHLEKDWLETFQVNVFTVYKLCSAFMPKMIENGFGRVVNMSSGIANAPQFAPYSASKAAIDKLTLDLAFNLDGTGVRINAMNPGWVRTDMGGANADQPVEAVLPGILEPVLIENDGPNGKVYHLFD